MAKAIFNGNVIAESETYEEVEGNVYFPAESLKRGFFRPSARHTICGWKGEASYLDVVVDGEEAPDAAWYYPSPKSAAQNIKGYVAFYPVVNVQR